MNVCAENVQTYASNVVQLRASPQNYVYANEPLSTMYSEFGA